MDNNNNKFSGTGKKGENPFTVPDNYFESFPQRLQQRMDEDRPVVSTPWERMLIVLKPQLAVAAVITVLIIAGYLGLRNFVFQQDMLLTDEEITGYIELYQHEFSDQHFLSLFDNDLYQEDFFIYGSLYSDDSDIYVDYLYNSDINLELLITDF